MNNKRPSINQMIVCNNVSNLFRNLAIFYRLSDHSQEVARAMENIRSGLMPQNDEIKQVADEIEEKLKLTLQSMAKLKYTMEDKEKALKDLVETIVAMSDQGQADVTNEIKERLVSLIDSVNKLKTEEK